MVLKTEQKTPELHCSEMSYSCKKNSLNNTKWTLYKSNTRYREIGGVVKTESTPTFFLFFWSPPEDELEVLG